MEHVLILSRCQQEVKFHRHGSILTLDAVRAGLA
jgi:hypothetical protein